MSDPHHIFNTFISLKHQFIIPRMYKQIDINNNYYVNSTVLSKYFFLNVYIIYQYN